MNQDEWNQSEAPNPFSSPNVDATAEVRLEGGPGYTCDGSALDSLSQGGKMMGQNFMLLLGIMVLAIVIRAPGDHMEEACQILGVRYTPHMALGATLYGLLVGIPITFGVAYVFLLGARGEKLQVGDLFAAFQRNYWRAIGAGFLKMLLVGLGMLLLLVPGIYLAIKLAFVEYLIVDQRMPIFESFRKSWEMTNGREGHIFLLGFLSLLIFIGGLFLCLIGVVFAVMWISAAYAVLYYTIQRSQEAQEIGVEPTSDNPFAN